MSNQMLRDARTQPIEPTEIVWEGPPSVESAIGASKNYRLESFVRQLKANPGHWAKYPEWVTNSYAAGLNDRFPNTEWATRRAYTPEEIAQIPEGRTRENTCRMWGRYNPPQSD